MKKLIALVLTVAMLATVFAFSASAAAAPELVLSGAATAAVDESYTVSIRLNDADNQVGGVQGELAYTGASIESIVVNPTLLTYNKTDDATTIAADDGDSVNFASVADLTGTNYATRIWIKVTFTIKEEGATFTLKNVVFSDKSAKELTGTVGSALAPEIADTSAKLNKVGMLNAETALEQGIVVNGTVTAASVNVKEYGVLFYPTQLLNGAALTLDTEGAIKASISEGSEEFESLMGDFDATLNLTYTDELKAAKFLGVKVTSVVYYITDDDKVVYSENNVDKYIAGGVANKAILNTALDLVADETADELVSAVADLDTESTMVANRNTVLKYAVGAAQ